MAADREMSGQGGRIPKEFIDDLLGRTDIVDVLREKGLPLKKSSAGEYSCCCPFHQERSPSFYVSEAKQVYYCFGCQAKGNVLSFLMRHDSLGYVEAVEYLADRLGIDVPREHGALPGPQALQGDRPVLERCRDFYETELRTSAAGQEMLSRYHVSPETAAAMHLGFAPSDRFISDNENGTFLQATIDALAETGMMAADSTGTLAPVFRDALMLPVIDRRGRLSAFSAVLPSGEQILPAATPVFSPDDELFGLSDARTIERNPEYFCLCPSPLDVLELRAAGSARGIAPFKGTVTPWQMKRILTSVGRLVVAVPVGEEGEELAKSAMLSAMPFLDDEKRITFRFLDGVSPGELVRKSGLQGFRDLERHDLQLEDFFFQILKGDADGKQDLALKTGLSMLEKLSPSTALRGSLLYRLYAECRVDPWELRGAWGASDPWQQESSSAVRGFDDGAAFHAEKHVMRGSELASAIMLHMPAAIKSLPDFGTLRRSIPQSTRPGLLVLRDVFSMVASLPSPTPDALAGCFGKTPEEPFLRVLAGTELPPETTEAGAGGEDALPGIFRKAVADAIEEDRDDPLSVQSAAAEADRSILLQDVIARRTLDPDGGSSPSLCCPFHLGTDRTLRADKDSQLFRCSVCGAEGDAVDFVREFDARSGTGEAADLILRETGHQIPERGLLPGERMLERAAAWYHRNLASSEEAQEYLRNRGITPETIERYSFGYAPDEWHALADALSPGISGIRILLENGLLIENDSHTGQYDRFRNRIMIPIRGKTGRIIAFGGRVLDDSKPKYLNSPESPLFSKSRELFGLYDALRKESRPEFILIVEGYMDVIALAQYGVTNAVASLGTATTPEQLRLIFGATDHLVCCYDGDAPGRKAAWHTLMTALPILNGSRRISFLFLPPEDDPDSFVRAHGKEGFLGYLHEHEMGLTDFIFDHERRGLGNAREDQITLLSRVIDCAVRMQQDSPWAREIRETFRPGGRFPGFEESYINALYNKRLRESKSPEPPPAPAEPDAPLSCINRLIATVLACPGGICGIPDLPSTMQVFARMIQNPAAMLLLDVIRVAQRNGGRDSAASLLREFEGSPCILWLRRLARRQDIDREAAIDRKQAEDEFNKDLNDILRQELGQLIEELSRRIAAGTGSDGDLRDLQNYVRMRNRIDDGSVSGGVRH